jgi:hypothetical protein
MALACAHGVGAACCLHLRQRRDADHVIDLREEEWIAAIPKGQRDVHAYTGYAMDAGRNGFYRLYTSLHLDEYIEFDVNDVVLAVKLGPAGDTLPPPAAPKGGKAPNKIDITRTVIWIKRDAIVEYGRALQVADGFLRGRIVSGFSDGDGGSGDGFGAADMGGGCVRTVSSRNPCG